MTWKTWTALFLTLLLALCLTACEDSRSFRGLVTEVQTDADGKLTAFVLENDNNGERIGILLAEKTWFWPQGISSGTTEEFRVQFQKELQVDVLASAQCYTRREELETAEGTVKAYWAESADIDGALERAALTLRDGTPVDVLREKHAGELRTYRLADGTELLRVDDPRGPENCHVMGLESFDDLNGLAQETIRDYYEDQGLLYDEMEELEAAYARYREKGEEAFRSGRVEQSVSPAGSSQRVMYFSTQVWLPCDHGDGCTTYIRNIFDAFDRETGEKIGTWDLFAAPKEDVMRTLLDKSGENNPARRRELEAVPWEGHISIGHDYVSVDFDPGDLPGQQHGSGFYVELEEVRDLLQPWAVPKNPEEAP